jgi:hypothetical protein
LEEGITPSSPRASSILTQEAIMTTEQIAETEEATKMLVSNEALSEIRVTIHHSLEAAVDLWLEAGSEELIQASELIRPAVERLGAIARENNFPE